MDARFQQRWKEIQTRFVDEPQGRSRTPIVWSRTSCSNSQRASQRNANGSKPSGAAGRTSPPRTCGSPCSAIAPSSSAYSRPDITAGSREVPRMSRGLTTIWRASLHSAIPHASIVLPGRCAAGSRSAVVSVSSAAPAWMFVHMEIDRFAVCGDSVAGEAAYRDHHLGVHAPGS